MAAFHASYRAPSCGAASTFATRGEAVRWLTREAERHGKSVLFNLRGSHLIPLETCEPAPGYVYLLQHT